jgi:hypothetical protein
MQVSWTTSLVDLHSSVAVATRKEAEPKMARSASLDSILRDALGAAMDKRVEMMI